MVCRPVAEIKVYSITYKIGMENMNDNNENIIQYCKNCFNIKECNCDNPEYVKTWDFVYWTFKNLKM